MRSQSRFHNRLAAAALLAAIAMASVARGDPQSSIRILSPDHSTRAVVRIEIADTPEKRELGLMYRKHLDTDAGMLFIFPEPQTAQFWMKNTEIPLDMIFANSSGRVLGIVANAKPYSEGLLGGFAGTSYVLEVNGGFAAQHGIVVGDQLELR